jgi:putative ABC transport system permease protein
MAYLPSLQSPPTTGWLLVRAQPGQASALPPLIRQAVRDIDPGLAVFDIRPLAEHLSLAHGTERLLAFLAAVYGTIATILAAVGLFGLLSYTVTRCTKEIGIRVALGAEPAAIRKQFAGQGLRRAAFGVVLGIGFTAIAGRLVRSLLFEVEPLDPLVLLGVSSVMLAVAVLASWWPAVRASRVDPMVALRSE